MSDLGKEIPLDGSQLPLLHLFRTADAYEFHATADLKTTAFGKTHAVLLARIALDGPFP